MRGASHAETPYPVGSIVGDATHFLCMSLQPPDPLVKRQGIVLAQTLDVSHLKAVQFRRAKACIDWY
jgi:hypothetical protein